MFKGAVDEFINKLNKERKDRDFKKLMYKTNHPYMYKLNKIVDKVMYSGAVIGFFIVMGIPLQIVLFLFGEMF